MRAKSRQDVRKQYNPYGPFCPDMIEDGKNYPIYGMAELVDGVIYSYLFRTIVTYRSRMNYKKDIFLEPPVLCRQVIYPFCPERLHAISELSEFSDAPAFCKSPFGWPSSAIGSRCISHLGDNMFCVVETADEFPEHENFQPVYINVFLLRGEVIEMLDSTIRFVGIEYAVRAEILHCFSPPDCKIEWTCPPATRLCSDFEERVREVVPQFCRNYIYRPSHSMVCHAQMLYAKWGSQLENSTARIILFFVGYMKCKCDNGPEPDPFLLVDTDLDKGLMKMQKEADSDMDWDKISVFFVSSFIRGCAWTLYKLEVLERGVVSSGLISSHFMAELEPFSRLSGTGIFERLGDKTYVFEGEPVGEDWEYTTITRYSAVNVTRNEWTYGEAHLISPKFSPIIVSDGTKLYALSSPPPLSSPSGSPASIPMPAFECFDPFLCEWQALKDAPFHFVPMDDTDVSGYALVDEYILICLEGYVCEYYAYNVQKDEWKDVTKLKNRNEYRAFKGQAQYVDGKIYSYSNKSVLAFALEKAEDGLHLHPPVELEGLEIVSPPSSWVDENYTECMCHLGGGMFCAIESGRSRISTRYQYACITTFSILNSAEVQTLHSSVRVIDINDQGGADLCYCFRF